MISLRKKIDLHIHTSCSDGEDSLRNVFNKIKKNKLAIFSICDHNYISPETKEIAELARKNHIFFLQGIELSCVDRETGESLHILGYSLNFDIELLNNFSKVIVDGYNERAKKIIKKLNKQYKNFNLDIEKLRKIKKEVYISRNTIAEELMKFLGSDNITRKESLKEVFIEEDDSWMSDPSDVIQIIKNAGGVAVLAHPGRLTKRLDNFESLLKRLVDYGISGIEAYYPKHNKEEVVFLNHLGEKYNLIITAGSDWHGENYTPDISIGITVKNKEYKDIINVFNGKTKPSSCPVDDHSYRQKDLIAVHN